MRKTIVRCLIPAVLLPATLVLAAPLPDFVKVDSDYSQYRRQLEKAGWAAHGTEVREEGGCLDYDQRCKDFPEARECSGTGMGYCNMVWKHEDGTILVIVTGGEEELTVVSASTE